MTSVVNIVNVACTKTKIKKETVQLEVDKMSLNPPLKKDNRLIDGKSDFYEDDCSATVFSSSEQDFDSENSTQDLSQSKCQRCCETTNNNSRFPPTRHDGTSTRRRVRFSDKTDTNNIEHHNEMSIQEKNDYWWTDEETIEMGPSYRDLRRLYQKCGKRGCIRGLEAEYWIKKMLNEADFSHFEEFMQPPRPSQKFNNDATKLYQKYLRQSQERAHVLALMDETFVMEHVYGLPCNHVDIILSEQWASLRCCSCHVNECRRRKLQKSSGQGSWFGRSFKRVLVKCGYAKKSV